MDTVIINQALSGPGKNHYDNPPITPEMFLQAAAFTLVFVAIGFVIWYFCKDK